MTVIFGLWPILRTARTSVGTYVGWEKIVISMLYNSIMPGLALISFFTVMLLATSIEQTLSRKTIIQIAMSVLTGCMISLYLLHEFMSKLVFPENR